MQISEDISIDSKRGFLKTEKCSFQNLENTDDQSARFSYNTTAFTGKERDEETGYSYFGARYYDSDLSGLFLSIDPMSDKYPNISPYAYCAWNPVKLVDPDGEEPILPPWILIKGIARGVEQFSSNSDVKTIAYAINNPIFAKKVGKAVDGGTNGISSFASNFAINMSKAANLSMEGEGSDRNAIRHTLWQAILTNEFGIDQAERIGNNHESGAKVDYSKRVFGNIEEADRLCDLLNNEIGRSIGKQNKDADNATMAKKVADEFYNSGLWTVSKNSEKNYIIQKTKISKLEYSKMVNEIKKLNNNGLHE